MTNTHDKYLALYRLGLDMADWYDQAHADIMAACALLHTGDNILIRPETLAGYLAAFSPRTSVRRSCTWSLHRVRNPSDFLQDCPRTIRACVLHFESTGRVRGPKVGPFHRALLGDPDAVVLDTHMARAAGYSEKFTVPQFRDMEDAVRSVARNRTTPARAQAAIWCGHLLSINRNPRYLPLLDVLTEPPLPPF